MDEETCILPKSKSGKGKEREQTETQTWGEKSLISPLTDFIMNFGEKKKCMLYTCFQIPEF